MHAASNGRLEIVKRLLAAGADPNLQNAMHHTALTSCNIHTPVMQALLEAGADPNIKTFGGHTALMYAIMKRNFDQTLLLLQHGADPDIAIGNGYNARWYAIEAGKAFVDLVNKFKVTKSTETTTMQTLSNIQQMDTKPAGSATTPKIRDFLS